MSGLNSRWAGLVAIDRYTYGGIHEADATAALLFTMDADSGETVTEPLTWLNAGLIWTYIAVEAPGVTPSEEEGAGAASLAFAAAATSSKLLELTGYWAGLIAPWRAADISITPTTEWRIALSAVLNGTVEPLDSVQFELPLLGSLAGDTAEFLSQGAVGTSTLTFTAPARAGFIGASTLSFTAFGAMTSVSSVLRTGVGEAAWAFSSAAEGAESWPIVMSATLAFAAPAESATDSEAAGTSTMTWATYGSGYQLDGMLGVAEMTFTSAALAQFRVLAAASAGLSFSASASSYLRGGPTRTVRAPAGRTVRVSR